MIILYDYFRSSASFRVRILLNLKKLAYQLQEVHLVNNGGEQHSHDYKKLNPFARVPTLVDGDFVLSQSLAILDYLEAQYPEYPMLPENTKLAATIKSFAQIIACDIHPIDNLSVLKYLQSEIGVDEQQKNQWYKHWIINGFNALEKILQENAGKYCFSDSVSLADICLVPQVYNANRFEVDMNPYPHIVRINQNCMQLDAFKKAAP